MGNSFGIRSEKERGIFWVQMGLSFENFLIHPPPPKIPESTHSAGRGGERVGRR